MTTMVAILPEPLFKHQDRYIRAVTTAANHMALRCRED
jgi:hypothetical protein